MQRVIEERDQLIEKITKLDKFLNSDPHIDTPQFLMLEQQFLIMKAYANILEMRIDDWSY